MTKISAKVIADSKNEFGNRITTMIVTFPRFILAELNTHRMMSRNSASSRAIPFEKMLASVENDPFIPIAFQKDHKGMQGTEYFTEQHEIASRTAGWLSARTKALEQAKWLSNLGVTKQLCNRLLEPFMWHTVIITATEWENFFALRCPKYDFNSDIYRSRKDVLKHYPSPGLEDDTMYWLSMNKGQAEIHMMELAEQMWDAYNESTPKELKAGEWHIPFGDGIDARFYLNLDENKNMSESEWKAIDKFKIKIATARCARVSYTVVGEEDKPANYEADIKLHDRLAESGHWSPFEHSAQAMNKEEYKNNKIIRGDSTDWIDESYGWSGNFKGFTQYRKTFNNENITRG